MEGKCEIGNRTVDDLIVELERDVWTVQDAISYLCDLPFMSFDKFMLYIADREDVSKAYSRLMEAIWSNKLPATCHSFNQHVPDHEYFIDPVIFIKWTLQQRSLIACDAYAQLIRRILEIAEIPKRPKTEYSKRDKFEAVYKTLLDLYPPCAKGRAYLLESLPISTYAGCSDISMETLQKWATEIELGLNISRRSGRKSDNGEYKWPKKWNFSP